MSSGHKNPANVAGGLKATINNPNTSQEAKDNARERLNDMQGAFSEVSQEQHEHHVLGGYKATLNNDRASDEAKAKARNVLDNAERGQFDNFESGDQDSSDQHRNHVLGGHKATLNNSNVPESTKEHSKEILEENDAI
ncbi:hypothetical protein D9758_000110 [Tetrapyrgos nigripes]|uniref:Conidiation-specific protein 6 n=1 Tax=Tetrapyrgos nigripes TaxID=182062 RepID=A0A8H5H1A9_9AGAR|nr:hypothetical protein D9758_000110 [Tetrapyrgos nigripes]